VNRAVRSAVGGRQAAPYLITRLDRVAGSQLFRYGLSLSPEAITIVP
jgi:hypothetical protein